MNAPDDPHPLRGVSSASAGAATESMTILPPSPQPVPHPPSTARAGVAIRLLEGFLIVGTVALAILLALLPARNSDVWLHLASGRLLARGQYSFGVDPFAFTTNGVYWVNPSWLYDLLSYIVYQLGQGTALVFAKVALMALLGWLLIRAGRPTGSREKSGNSWVAVVFAVCALLIVGSSMPLRPIGVSYVLLALTLWLLERGLAEERPTSLASWWPVPLLFAVWANLDAWFILGPLTVGLYFLGTLLAGPRRTGQVQSLGLLCVAGLVACLLNPHHYHVFTLPTLFPFTAEATILRDDPVFSRLFLTPFQTEYLRFQDIPHLGRLLYYPLLLVGAVSFLVNAFASRPQGSGAVGAGLRRLPAWLFFVALSAVDASLIPFMAIVTAPLAALNFQEYAQRRAAKRSRTLPPSPEWSIGGRIVTLTILVGLLIAAWPGWLQGQLRAPRGWFVEANSSLVEAAQQVAQWRHDGRLTSTQTGFNFSPAAAHYFAWFSPDAEKSFCDERWQLYAATAKDYLTVRRAFLGHAPALDAARRILREHQVAYLVLDTQSAAVAFQRLILTPNEWGLLFLRGDTLIVGWRDSEQEPPTQPRVGDRFAGWRIDLQQRAFRPTEDECAPAQGAVLGSDPTGWRSFWTLATPAPSHADDEAALYLTYFDMLRPTFLTHHRLGWEYGLAAAIISAGPGITNLPGQFLDASAFQVSHNDGPRPRLDGGVWPLDALVWNMMQYYDMGQDDGPPGLALLAVRAARRAVNENPLDARAYQLLGEAYLHLAGSTRERTWKRDLPSLSQVRQLQAAVALHRALQLQPDLIQPHTDLFLLYQDMGYLDLALQQLRHIHRLTPTHGSLPGESRDAQNERLRQTAKGVEALDAEVKKREARFENQAARASVAERALRARDNGLAGKALEILLASDVAVFGKEGTQLELELLLTVGRIDDAREWMAPSQETELGSDTYHRLRVQLAAAAGDYQACDEELAQMAALFNRPMNMIFLAHKFSHWATSKPAPAVVRPVASYRLQTFPEQVACMRLGQILMDAPGQKQSIPQLLMNRLQITDFLEHSQKLGIEIRKQADVQTLRGVLALERGEVALAETYLRRAAVIGRSGVENASAGRSAAEGMLDWLSRRPEAAP